MAAAERVIEAHEKVRLSGAHWALFCDLLIKSTGAELKTDERQSAAITNASVNETEFAVKALAPHHNREAFSRDEPVLDAYLRRQASQYVQRRLAQVFVAVGETPDRIPAITF
jgi:hypothetical protein